MPPIFGILTLDGTPPDKIITERMRKAATYVVPRVIKSLVGDWGSFNVAVIEKYEHQDYIVENESYIIIADAKIYHKQDEIFKINNVRSDSQWILASWQKWGKACVNKLKGDFSFVIFDKKNKEIFCGRDQIGIKPFYYAIERNSFIFSSELRLIKSAFPDRKILREYLFNVLTGAKSKRNQTGFQGLLRLRPGHEFLWNGETAKQTQYWKPDVQRKIRFNSDIEYINLFREQLISAIAMRCSSEGNFGMELSGGLDSSAILGIAIKILSEQNKEIATFSNVLPEGYPDMKDEKELINAMTSFSRCKSFMIDNIREDVADLMQHSIEIQACYTELHYNVYNKALFETAALENISVLFSGFGGDEVASAGILMPWEELLRQKQWGKIFDELFYDGLRLRSIIRTFRALLRIMRIILFPWYVRKGPFSSGKLKKKFNILPLHQDSSDFKMVRKLFFGQYHFKRLKHLVQRQIERLSGNAFSLHLEYCYCAAAQYGIEYRYPLLDIELIETALAFPPWIKLHHGIKRYAFRQAIKGFVPEKIRQRNDKSGQTIPHMNLYFRREQENIKHIIESARKGHLNKLIDFSSMEKWLETIINNDKKDMKVKSPGLFCNYLMVLYYYTHYEKDEP